MKQKILFFAFLCFLIMVLAGVPVSASESESSSYILNLNDGDIFISKSPSSDYRSMGDLLIINYGGGKIDFVPAELAIRITSSGLPTTNQIIVNGAGLSERTIVHLTLIDTVWDQNQGHDKNKSGIVDALNNSAVKITYERNNSILINSDAIVYFENGSVVYYNAEDTGTGNKPVVIRGGPVKISGFEIGEDGTVNIGSFRVEKNVVRIGVIQIDEDGIRWNKESDFVREIIPSINYLISIFIYFF